MLTPEHNSQSTVCADTLVASHQYTFSTHVNISKDWLFLHLSRSSSCKRHYELKGILLTWGLSCNCQCNDLEQQQTLHRLPGRTLSPPVNPISGTGNLVHRFLVHSQQLHTMYGHSCSSPQTNVWCGVSLKASLTFFVGKSNGKLHPHQWLTCWGLMQNTSLYTVEWSLQLIEVTMH